MASEAKSVASLKDAGNNFFRNGKFEEAAAQYSEALQLVDGGADGGSVSATELSTIHSNRSASYLKLGQAEAALADADKCVALREEWEKGHFRRGCALEELGEQERALEAYLRAASINSSNKEVVLKVRALTKTVKAQATRGKRLPSEAVEFLDHMAKILPTKAVADIKETLENLLPKLTAPEAVQTLARKVVTTAHACALLDPRPAKAACWQVLNSLQIMYPAREQWLAAVDVYEAYRAQRLNSSHIMPFLPNSHALLSVIHTFTHQPEHTKIFSAEYVRQAVAVLNNEVVLKTTVSEAEVYTQNNEWATLQREGGVEDLLQLAARHGPDRDPHTRQLAQEASGTLHNIILPALTCSFSHQVTSFLMEFGALFDRTGNPLDIAMRGGKTAEGAPATVSHEEAEQYWAPIGRLIDNSAFRQRCLEIIMRVRVLTLQLVEDSSGPSAVKTLSMLRLLYGCMMNGTQATLDGLTSMAGCTAFVKGIDADAELYVQLLAAFSAFGYKSETQ